MYNMMFLVWRVRRLAELSKTTGELSKSCFCENLKHFHWYNHTNLNFIHNTNAGKAGFYTPSTSLD